MASVAIRPATEADRDELEALIGECYAEIYPGWYDADMLSDALPMMLRIDPALLASGHYFVATVDGRLAGCGGWSLSSPGRTPDEGGTGHIRHFATKPGLMRQGVGGAIIEACIREARTSGVRKLKCFSSLPAEAFYARNGFKRIDEVSVMLGESTPFPAVLMEMDLA